MWKEGYRAEVILGLARRVNNRALPFLNSLKTGPSQPSIPVASRGRFSRPNPLPITLAYPFERTELDEIAFGILEGRNLYQFDEVTKNEWERFKDDRFNYRIPGAENYTDVANRIKPFIEKTLRDHEGRRF